MRILFISAFYPPAVIGGWEQLVEEINHHLSARGHTTHVLTSTHGIDGLPDAEGGIDRLLHLESDLVHYGPRDSFLKRGRRLAHNLSHLRETVERFAPDVIFVHIMWNLSRAIPWLAEQLLPGRVVYYLAEHWPYAPDVHTAYWRQPAGRWFMKLPKRIVAWAALRGIARERADFPLQFRRVLCVSRAIREGLLSHAGVAPESASVVYNGIDVDRFVPREGAARPSVGERGLSLLYAGSVVPHKGVHTAVEAMAILSRTGVTNISLTIVGSGHPEYEAGLRAMAETEGLNGRVRFHGRIPRDEMPAFLQGFDVLVFPSIWDEPLARMMQEAMASGLVVVGTTTGGSGEILVEGETGLTFPAEDSATLATQIVRLSRNRELQQTLVRNARSRVVRDFNIHRTVDEIETHLAEVATR